MLHGALSRQLNISEHTFELSFPLLTEISLRRQRHSLENKTAEERRGVLKTQIYSSVTS
jgi:hypothetical protein